MWEITHYFFIITQPTSFPGFFLVNCKVWELYPFSLRKDYFLLEPAIGCTIVLPGLCLQSAVQVCIVYYGLICPLNQICHWVSAIQARLWAACQSSQQRVKAELGKKKKKKRSSFLSPSGDCWSGASLGITVRAPDETYATSTIYYNREGNMLGVQHPQSTVIFKTAGLILNALCSRLRDVETWMFTNLMTCLISNDAMSH